MKTHLLGILFLLSYLAAVQLSGLVLLGSDPNPSKVTENRSADFNESNHCVRSKLSSLKAFFYYFLFML